MKILLLALLRAYQYLVSPLLRALCGPGCGCRFEPSCSHYAVQAIQSHGAAVGSWLALRRLLRCHPWGGHGYDPVPNTNSHTS